VSTTWSSGSVSAAVIAGLSPVIQNEVTPRLIRRMWLHALKDSTRKNLLPEPYRMVLLDPYALFCEFKGHEAVRVHPIHIDALFSIKFLSGAKERIPEGTELWWSAEAGLGDLRQAFVEALRLGKLLRVADTLDRVWLEWSHYGLGFTLDGYRDGAPSLEWTEPPDRHSSV